MAEINRSWVLVQRPVGEDFDAALKLQELPVPEPAEGQVLARTLYLSLDPANRGWMAGPTYIPAVPVGGPMWGGVMGRVVKSRSDKFKEGDIVYLWKATRAEEPDRSILAYEGQADTLGNRVVLLQNGETKMISAGEFNGLPKVPTRK